jgi:hypothetical protein
VNAQFQAWMGIGAASPLRRRCSADGRRATGPQRSFDGAAAKTPRPWSILYCRTVLARLPATARPSPLLLTRLELHRLCVSAHAAAKPPQRSRRYQRRHAARHCSFSPASLTMNGPAQKGLPSAGAQNLCGTTGGPRASWLFGPRPLRLKRACEQLLGPPQDSLPTRSHWPPSPWSHPWVACLSCSRPTDLLFSA